jgi:hypothetical protein
MATSAINAIFEGGLIVAIVLYRFFIDSLWFSLVLFWSFFPCSTVFFGLLSFSPVCPCSSSDRKGVAADASIPRMGEQPMH